MRINFCLVAVLAMLPTHAQELGEADRLEWQAYQLAVAEAPGDAISDLLMAKSLDLLVSPYGEAGRSEPSQLLVARAEVVAAQLHARVDAVRDSDPYLLGADLGCGRSGDAAVCSERRAKLEPFAGDDAYHGLLLMVAAWGAGDAEGFLRAARLAANAESYNSAPASGFGSLVARYRQVPPPSAQHADHLARGHGPEVTAMSLAMAISLPNFLDFTRPCRESEGELRRHCLAIANRMMAQGSNLIETWIAQSVVEALGTPADTEAAKAMRRETAWLQAQSHPLMVAAAHGPVAGFDAYFDAYARSGELAAMRALLEVHGIPPAPPADWSPEGPRSASAP